jgi:predicted RND superfamily exporter protein
MNENNRSIIYRFSWSVSRHRLAILIITVMVTSFFGYGMANIKGDVILRDMFPYDHPYLKMMAQFAQVFGGGGSGVAIAVKAKNGDIFNHDTLANVQKMTNEIFLWQEIYRVLTVSIASRSVTVVKPMAKGAIRIKKLMWPDLPQNEAEIKELEANIFSNPAYNGTLVSRDGTAALVLTEFKEDISYERAHQILRKLVADYSDDKTSVHVVGFPSLMGWIYSYKTQIVMVMGVSVGLMVLILILIFRNFMGMAVPILFAAITTTLGLGFIGWTGINFSPLLYVLAFLVGARIVSHSVQITHRYLEEFQQGGNRVEACARTMYAMLVPNWAGVTTDAAGFLVLILAKIALMQQVALFMSFWMITVLLCAILTPILCSFLPLGRATKEYDKQRQRLSFLDRLCMAAARFSIGSGRSAVIILTAALLVFCVWQGSRLKIGDPTPGSPLLWPDHPYNQDQVLINHIFDASSENLVLYYEGEKESVYDPVVLITFEAFDRHMKSSLPDIYKSSNSIINIVKMVNQTYHDGDPAWYQLPLDETLLTGLIGILRQSVDPPTVRRYFDDPMERSQITLFFADHTSDNLLRIRDAAYGFFKERSMKTEKGEFKLAGGRIGMEIAVNDEMKASHVKIDSLVLITIFILCILFYRSMVAALMLTLPLILANLVAFAYMALNNIGLSINTLPVAAVGVGVGIDYAMYIYSRCREEYPLRKNWEDTIMAAVRTSGKAVVFTGLTMILPIITWFFLSDMKFQAQMGVFLAMIMGMNVITALTLHAFMIYKIRPRFISGIPRNASKDG